MPERDRAVAANASPFGRVGAPDDVAEIAAFLASDAGHWVTGQTGQTIQAGGGVA